MGLHRAQPKERRSLSLSEYTAQIRKQQARVVAKITTRVQISRLSN